MIILDNGIERCACHSDFENVSITFTPDEWQELDKKQCATAPTSPCSKAGNKAQELGLEIMQFRELKKN